MSTSIISSSPLRIAPSLRLYSKLVCGAVVFLIFMGALVTSNDAGLAVPDWPTSYGENMFLFPPSKWRGIIFFEHVHRLIASVVGLMTLILAVWIGFVEKRRWVRWTAFAALGAVILQGILGGLTVLYKLPLVISAAHGVLAQTFLLLVIVLAYSQSLELESRVDAMDETGDRRLFRGAMLFGSIVYLQLIVGALMRHSEAGIAVPDFPLMAHRALPSLDTETIQEINAMRASLHLPAVDGLQVFIHLLHRAGGFLVIFAALALQLQAFRSEQFRGEKPRYFWQSQARSMIYFVGYLVLIQFTLGVFSLLSVRHPLITSLHVALGAVLLGVTAFLCLRLFPVRGKVVKR